MLTRAEVEERLAELDLPRHDDSDWDREREALETAKQLIVCLEPMVAVWLMPDDHVPTRAEIDAAEGAAIAARQVAGGETPVS